MLLQQAKDRGMQVSVVPLWPECVFSNTGSLLNRERPT